MKKIALLMLVFTLFAGTNVYAQKLKNGTYKGNARGYSSEVKVKVSVSGGKIKDIDVDTNEEPIGSNALSQMVPEIIRAQSTIVDVVGGATITSEAFIFAVNNALEKRNPDIVRAWEQEGAKKRLATAQRVAQAKAEAEAEAERRRLEAQAEAERQRLAKAEQRRLEEEARQQRIAEVLKQTPVTPAASEFKYDLADGTYGGVKIIKYLGEALSIRIPEKIEGLPVTEIEEDAFDKNTLVKIVIHGTIKKMMSFSGFTELREVIFEDSVTAILGTRRHPNGYDRWGHMTGLTGVFEDCTNLNKVTIGKSVAAIPERCFAGCTNLSKVIIPNSVKTIGSFAFLGSGLTSIVIPDSVTGIGSSAFLGSGLTSIVIPDSVTSIGSYAFENCTSLNEIAIPDSVTSIGVRTFANTAMTSIIIPDSVDSIAVFAFYECKSLVSVTLPASLRLVRGGAFAGCSSLSEVKIPASLKTVKFENYSYSSYKDNDPYLKNTYYMGKDGGKYQFAYDYYNNETRRKHYEYDVFVGCSSLPLATKSKLRELGYGGDF